MKACSLCSNPYTSGHRPNLDAEALFVHLRAWNLSTHQLHIRCNCTVKCPSENASGSHKICVYNEFVCMQTVWLVCPEGCAHSKDALITCVLVRRADSSREFSQICRTQSHYSVSIPNGDVQGSCWRYSICAKNHHCSLDGYSRDYLWQCHLRQVRLLCAGFDHVQEILGLVFDYIRIVKEKGVTAER